MRDLRIVEYFIEGTADYFIEGTADSVDITMTNAQGNTEQATGIAVPMTAGGEEGLSLGHVESGTFVYLSAQNRGRSGTVTCRITINGSTVSTATSKGAYVIAVCDAVVP